MSKREKSRSVQAGHAQAQGMWRCRHKTSLGGQGGAAGLRIHIAPAVAAARHVHCTAPTQAGTLRSLKKMSTSSAGTSLDMAVKPTMSMNRLRAATAYTAHVQAGHAQALVLDPALGSDSQHTATPLGGSIHGPPHMVTSGWLRARRAILSMVMRPPRLSASITCLHGHEQRQVTTATLSQCITP